MKTARDYSGAIRHADKLFIDGAWVTPATNRQFDVVAPSSEETFARVAEAQATDIERAVAAARAAFDSGPWPRMPHVQRATFLRDMAREIRARADQLSGLLSSEVGSLYARNLKGVPDYAGAFDFYADMAETFRFTEAFPGAQGGPGFLVREPVGVVAAIVPWNSPLMIACWKIAPALLAGCTVILKASPEAPSALLALAEVAEAVGLPKGVLNVLTADREVSELLVRHTGVDKVSFTGSTAAGKRVGAICGERVARCTLELGGKSPAILLDDYDVEKFADTISATSVLLTGQICSLLTRVIVPRSRQASLLEATRARLENIRVGSPFDPATQMGPLAMKRQRDRVEGYIEKGRAEGATLVTGGSRPAHLEKGYYVQPTLFGNVDNNATIAREEIFGPVLSVIPAADEAQAIEIANSSHFGLNAAVFTNDPDRALAVARRIRSGTVAQNAFRVDFRIGFGGFKESGIGREGGEAGLTSYLENKTILLEKFPATLERV